MLRPLRIDDIGGAKVVRTFTMGSRRMRAGEPVEMADLRKMPTANRNALIEKGFISVWPRGPAADGVGVVASGSGERFVVTRGFGRYDVVEGVKLNDKSMGRDAAYALAGRSPPEKATN